MYQRIFVPVDDSETSALALAEACKLAKEVGAAVKMVHVVDLAQFGWGGAEFLDAAELQGSIREAGEQVLSQARTRAEALGVVRPRVALLNIGTEDIKGNQQVKLAATLLQNARGLNYVGFVEGDGLYRGEADVVVCDGFVGNILLKSSEGLATMIGARIEALFKGGVLARAAGALAMPLLKRLQADLAPARHNGASFLGLQGIVVKSHGSAGVEGFQSAIARAVIEIQENLPQRLHGRLEDLLP